MVEIPVIPLAMGKALTPKASTLPGHQTRLRPVDLPDTFRAALFASACDPPPSTSDEMEHLEGLLLAPKAPTADATEALCRRLHIEALAVSIAAMHLEERSDGAPEEDATRGALVRHIADRAVQVTSLSLSLTHTLTH